MNEQSGLCRQLGGMIPSGLQINGICLFPQDSGLTSEPDCNVLHVILYAEHPMHRLRMYVLGKWESSQWGFHTETQRCYWDTAALPSFSNLDNSHSSLLFFNKVPQCFKEERRLLFLKKKQEICSPPHCRIMIEKVTAVTKRHFPLHHPANQKTKRKKPTLGLKH